MNVLAVSKIKYSLYNRIVDEQNRNSKHLKRTEREESPITVRYGTVYRYLTERRRESQGESASWLPTLHTTWVQLNERQWKASTVLNTVDFKANHSLMYSPRHKHSGFLHWLLIALCRRENSVRVQPSRLEILLINAQGVKKIMSE